MFLDYLVFLVLSIGLGFFVQKFLKRRVENQLIAANAQAAAPATAKSEVRIPKASAEKQPIQTGTGEKTVEKSVGGCCGNSKSQKSDPKFGSETASCCRNNDKTSVSGCCTSEQPMEDAAKFDGYKKIKVFFGTESGTAEVNIIWNFLERNYLISFTEIRTRPCCRLGRKTGM